MIELYELELSELEAYLAAWGEPPTLAREVWQWLYSRCVTDFSRMLSLPPSLRARLASDTRVTTPILLAHEEAPGGEARKDLLQLEDGEQVEVVRLRYRRRYSGCISTQVGCACGCAFCATGQMGFVRDLTAGEIVAQVTHLQRELMEHQRQLSNVVLMGMGEPLLNVEATLSAVRRLIDPRAVGIAPRRVTLSTVGIVPGIERLAGEELPIGLAVSLHAATDDLRDRLMPINRRYPLRTLLAAVEQYTHRTQRRVLFEWLLIEGCNDTVEQARALAGLLAGIPAHVNLMRLNPTGGYGGRPAPSVALERFASMLDRAGIPHTVRQRRGSSIAAGCGQLRSRSHE